MTLSDDHKLSRREIEAYQRDGHVAIRGLLTPEEVAAVRADVQRLVRERTANVAPLADRDTYGKAFLQAYDLNKKSGTVRDFVYSRRLARVAAELMGVPAVRLYFDQALFKEPGGGLTPWHQDHTYWPIDTENMVTMWSPLADISSEVGSLEFVSGSHLGKYREYMVISDESEVLYQRLVDEQGLRAETHGAMAVGDATFHAAWTLHRAPANPGKTMREVLTVIYFEDGARLVSDFQPSQMSDIELYFQDSRPGDLVANDLMPVLYSEESAPAAG